MKLSPIILVLLLAPSANSQVINHHFNETDPNPQRGYGIVAQPHDIRIIVNTVYRAKPDGYHITFTTSFIGKTVEEVEAVMNKKMDSLIERVKEHNIQPTDVVVEVAALDPIFPLHFENEQSSAPMGYKITENLTFHVRQFQTARYLAKSCMDFGIYDIVRVQPYVLQADKIYDTLADKTVEILDFKKDLCQRVGRLFTSGVASFTKSKQVIYPSDAYLRSQLKSSRLYMHDVRQNSEVLSSRIVTVDQYRPLDLRDADFVFHPDLVVPAIEFYYQISYNYLIPEEEEEKEEAPDGERTFYILDNQGELKKISFD